MPELEVRCRTRIFRTCPKGLQWRDNSYANGRSWADVAWDVFVFDRVSDGPDGAALHQYAHGAFRAPGGRDERPFLIVLGAIWGHVELPPRVEKAARWSALYGTYSNWLFTTLGAAMGTAAANQILSQRHHGKPWQERVAGAGFRSVTIAIFSAVALILCGLGRRR